MPRRRPRWEETALNRLAAAIPQEAIQELEEEAAAQDERDEDVDPGDREPELITPDTVFEAPPMPEREVLLPVDPLYERQHSLGLHTPSVALIGCGGVGCWVALSLVLGGVTDLTLFDGDVLSIHNLNRFPLGEGAIGEMKSVALARWLRTLRPKAEIQARGEFDPAIHHIDPQWIVCTTDSLKSRQMCHLYANAPSIRAKYLEVGADGERWGLSPSPPEFSTELEDSPGYSTVPVHVGPCMMAGAAAAYYVLHDIRPTMSHSCDWRGYPNLQSLMFESMDEREEPQIEEEVDPPDMDDVRPEIMFNPRNGTTAFTETMTRDELERRYPAHFTQGGREWTDEEAADHDRWEATVNAEVRRRNG